MNRVFTEALLTECPKCGSICYRGQTNRTRDPYYLRSKKLRRARVKYKRDLLQVGDSKFDLYHPQQKRERLDKENQEERELWQRKQLGA